MQSKITVFWTAVGYTLYGLKLDIYFFDENGAINLWLHVLFVGVINKHIQTCI